MAFGAGVLLSKTDTFSQSAGAVEPDQESFTTRRVEIDSFDGTTLVATVYEPTAEGPHPAILATHGWASSRIGAEDIGSAYASREYVALIYDSRGFGESGGEVTLTGENEERDARALISWLADQEFVLTEGADNPRLGMDGRSYGGGIQLRVAASDDRVDAIVPRHTWYDLTQALAPNDVIKSGWATGLLTAGSTTGTLDSDFVTRSERLVETGELAPDDRQYFESRSTVSYPEDIDAATLLVQAFTDRLFPATEGVDNFRWASEADTETAIILGNGGPHGLFNGTSPGEAAFDTLADEAAFDWMDAHLKGGDHDLPPVTYYDQGDDEFVEADQFPPSGATPETFTRALDGPVTLSGPDGGPVSFDWELDREREIVGTPSLELAVRPTGEGQRNLMAALARVSGGEMTTIKQQVTPVAVETETTVSFELACIQTVLAAGDRLRLVLATGSEQLAEVDFSFGQDGLFRNTAEGAGVELRDTAAIELTVPTSVTPPPIVAGREPANPTGDGLYRRVRGENRFTILDVQALFDNLDNPTLQKYSAAFNFSESDPGEVTVADVQALFDDLRAGVGS
jgi:predicted acyl esterase